MSSVENGNRNGSNSNGGSGSVSIRLVDRLIAMLDTARDISRMDMAVTNVCCMSADLGFMIAYRRLSKERFGMTQSI